MSLFKPNVDKLKKRQDISGLVKALEYEKNAKVRSQSAEALGQLGSASAKNALTKALLNDPEEMVRSAAAFGLRRLGGPSTRKQINLLLKGLGWSQKDDELILEMLYFSNTKLLVEIVYNESINYSIRGKAEDFLFLSNGQALNVIAGNKNMSKQVRENAKELLNRYKATLFVKQGEFERAARMGAAAVIPFSRAIRSCPGNEQRASLAEWMNRIDDPAAVKPLLMILDTAYDDEIEAVVRLFDKFGDVRVVEPLDKWVRSLDIISEFTIYVKKVINRLRKK